MAREEIRSCSKSTCRRTSPAEAPTEPTSAPAALPAAFLGYVLSDEAQALVGQEGFLPAAQSERDTQKTLIRATISNP